MDNGNKDVLKLSAKLMKRVEHNIKLMEESTAKKKECQELWQDIAAKQRQYDAMKTEVSAMHRIAKMLNSYEKK